MEPVVYEESPLADYLKGTCRHLSGETLHAPATANGASDGGDESEADWAAPADTPSRDSSIGSSPSPFHITTGFAPTGRPSIKARFRRSIPVALGLEIPEQTSFRSLKGTYSVGQSPRLTTERLLNRSNRPLSQGV